MPVFLACQFLYCTSIAYKIGFCILQRIPDCYHRATLESLILTLYMYNFDLELFTSSFFNINDEIWTYEI